MLESSNKIVVEAVSYTHLDVYKRQEKLFSEISANFNYIK